MNLTQKLNLKTKLLTVDIVSYLKGNLESHKEDYKKAVDVYNDDLRDTLKQLSIVSDKASSNLKDADSISDVTKKYNKYSFLKKPVDATKMYEEYIAIFSASQDKEIELTLNDANAIINDSWDWAIEAKTSNAMYSSRY